MNSCKKGKRGEREAAKVLTELLGYECRRGQQHSGVEGRDVVGPEGLHVEVKRNERLNVEAALRQAERDAQRDDVPIVMHRRNGDDWKITLRAKDITRLAGLVYLTMAHNA